MRREEEGGFRTGSRSFIRPNTARSSITADELAGGGDNWPLSESGKLKTGQYSPKKKKGTKGSWMTCRDSAVVKQQRGQQRYIALQVYSGASTPEQRRRRIRYTSFHFVKIQSTGIQTCPVPSISGSNEEE